MIVELTIHNLGLIDKSHIVLKDKLNVITGESGSGKSLILKGIYLLFNDRVNKEYIGEFGDELYINLVCEPNDSTLNFLKENSLPIKEDDYLIIEKTISKTKKTVSRINHQIVTQDLFKKLSPYIVSFSLQNETSLFQNPDYILNILDSEHKDVLQTYQTNYHKYEQLHKEIVQLIKDKKNNEDKKSFYEFQLKELEDFNIQENDFELDAIMKKAKNQEKISKVASIISNQLREAHDILESAFNNMQNLKAYDETYEINDFSEYFYELEDYEDTINDYINKLDEYSENDITFLQSRIFKLKDLQKKFGLSYEDFMNAKEDLAEKLNNITNFEDILKQKKKELKSVLESEVLPYAEKLNQKRLAYGSELSEIISKHLSEMGMENTKVIFSISKLENVNKYGYNQIDILIQHLQQEAKLLSKIASGGELSRIILALKIVTSEKDNSSVMLFDEIDSGTGGKTANYIGQKLQLLSTKKQVICITHTPQVACYSDNHVFVQKKVEDNKYISESTILEENDVVMEIARMISGNEINNISIENAKQLRNNKNK